MAEQLLKLDDVAELLSTSVAQVYAMVRRGELIGIKIGGRGQWRVSESDLDDYVRQQRAATQRFVDSHPFDASEASPEEAER